LLPWLAELLGMSAAGESEAFDELVGEVSEAPAGSDGLLFVPHLDGRLLPSDPTMRGAWVGLHSGHRRPHLVRSVLESVAYEYAGYLRAIEALEPGFAPAEGRVVGGGARSAAWNAIKASVLDVTLCRLDREELSCWGAALVAGHAVGLVDDLAAAAEQATSVSAQHAPDLADRDAYAAYEPVYRDAVAMASGIGRRLSGLAADRREVTA
jgi:xylulokinase